MARRPAGDVEAEIDRLFELSPERFVAERDATAQRLRSGGDVEAAARVTKLRRPTVAAWALDQLARRRPDDVRELTALGDDLRRAQRRALSGVGADELRELGARRRRLVEGLTQAAEEVLGDAGRASSPSIHQAIASTLEAAAVSADDAAALQLGRLERDLSPQSGFDAVDGFSVVEPLRRGTRAQPKPARPSASDRRRLEAARSRVREASQQADIRRDAEQHAAESLRADDERADAAATEVAELERALREARAELDDARQRSRASRRELDAARRATGRAMQEMETARAALDGIEGDD